LESLRIPITELIKQNLVDRGYELELESLDLIIQKSIDIAISRVEEKFRKFLLTKERIVRANIEEYAMGYVDGILSQTKKWKSLKEMIRIYKSIFVIGAGMSFESGLPLSKHLEHLFRLCNCKSFKDLRDDKSKGRQFKLKFLELCDANEPTISHHLILENFTEKILQIICLNWDNLLERCGRTINKEANKIAADNSKVTNGNYIWKFHGDVENISEENEKGKGGWIFPDENGYVFESFHDFLNRPNGLAESSFVMVIVGYGEMDAEISKLINAIEEKQKRTTFRIGLDLSLLNDDKYLVGTAAFTLSKVL